MLLTFFYIVPAHAEGFAAGTLIKTPSGYAAIENIKIGDQIICFDTKKQLIVGQVIHVTKKSINEYVCIAIEDEDLCIARDQQLYDTENDSWIVVESLKKGDVLSGNEVIVESINQPIDVYLLSVAPYHNFLVTKADISAHNFFPLVLGFSVAFGAGLELAGLSMGFAGLGGFLGYQWHKKNKQKHNLTVQLQFSNNGMMPEDPEEEKKRKRNEAREEYRSLTAKEAQKIAKEFGHRKVKSHPCGNTRNQPVFFNGKNYISPDIDGHNGGLWKVFDRRGNILYSTTRKFEKVVKIYTK